MPSLILPPKTFLAYSLGCRTNQAELEEISLRLIAYGLQQTLKEPDIVLLNTCVVTAKAEKETRQKIRELKKKFPKSKLVVMGCGVTAKDKFGFSLPEADLFVPNENKDGIINLLILKQKNGQNDKNVTLDNKYIQSGRKFVKIQDGCDRFCSFCLTCCLRGTPKSIPPEKIINEINFWVKNDIKEIILTGINTGLYHNLTGLLNKILKETKIERISFSSIYPEMLTDEFLKIVIANPRISQYFHLSLQSGSRTILERMNRNTDLGKLSQKINKIKRKNHHFTFRSDIIVGFPYETEEEFKETLNFIKGAKISFSHVFPYSKRKGTAAYLLPDLPNQIKKERVKRIVEAVKAVRQKEAKALINETFNCLIVRNNEGITENGWNIKIKNQTSKIKNFKGKILLVKIIGFEENYLVGKIVSLPIN